MSETNLFKFKEFERRFKRSGKEIENVFYIYSEKDFKPYLVSKKNKNENIYQAIVDDIDVINSL
jgi:uncharacterized protein YkuJ